MSKRYAGGIVTAVFKPLDPHGDNNSLYVWGGGNIGEMGLNDRTARSSPVQVDSGVTWSKIYGFGNHNQRLAIKQNGTMWAWGQNDDGQLGVNDVFKRSSPTQIGTLTTWATGAVGLNGPAAIKTDGSLWLWGKNSYGQLGINNVLARSSPVQVGSTPGPATSWSEASAGNTHAMALRPDGTLWTWGSNNKGQLGDNSVTYRSSPIQVGSSTTWSQVGGGQTYSMALKADGTMWTWGNNTQSLLGDNTTLERSSPVQIGALTTWSSIAAGGSGSMMALKDNGTLWSWGINNRGQVGDGTEINRSSPVQVGALTTWSKIATGGDNSAAIKTDGTMWLWGLNNYGTIGDELTFHRSSPVQVGALTTWSKVALGNNHTMAIKTDGTLWAWGRNNVGQLGDNTTANKSSPIQVGSLTTWSQIDGGNSFAVALKNDGTMWLWGNNDYGQQGTSTTNISRSSPVQVGSLATWSKISAGTQGMSFAIETDGSWYSWGRNASGGLGDDTVINRSSPVQVGTEVYGWSLVSRGGYHTAAIRADGTLWAWGRNQVGQHGRNDTVLRSSPVQLGTDTNWSKVSASTNCILAIKADNSLWVWGYQDQGVLGINSVTPVSSPVQVGATTDWSLIASTRYHAGAIKTNGTLWTWGKSSDHGQLGLGDRVDRSSPVQVGSDTNWSLVSAGTNTTAATKTIGTLYIWGDGRHGEMGDNTAISRSSPVQLGSISTWADVSVGSDDSAQSIFAISSIPF